MSRITYLLLSALVILQIAGGTEVFMSTRESLTFSDNVMLFVLDVNPHTETVWIELRDENGIFESSVINVGDKITYGGEDELDLTLSRIYAGGDEDLVVFEVNSGELVGRSSGKNDSCKEGLSEDSKSVPISGAAMMAALVSALLAARRRFQGY